MAIRVYKDISTGLCFFNWTRSEFIYMLFLLKNKVVAGVVETLECKGSNPISLHIQDLIPFYSVLSSHCSGLRGFVIFFNRIYKKLKTDPVRAVF